MVAIESSVLDKIEKIVGSKYLLTNPDSLYNYSKDCTSNKEVIPTAVVQPKNTQEVSEIITLCNETKTKITVRGGGTGVSGGALSYYQGIILSLERLNKIIEINKVDRIAIVESGVITQDLREAVLNEGLNFPQNISSASSCFIGGNVAVASGSPKSLKYGTTKNYVVNLEVVLPDGSIIWTGKNVSKNATGYNLTQLFSGSEGTLGIITKVVLKLVPPMKELVFMAPFTDINNLFKCVKHFFEKGYSASSIEFIDAVGFKLASQFLENTFHTTSDVQGVLWIELEGEYPEKLMEKAIEIGEFVNQYTKEEVHIADTPTEVKKLWEMRSKVGEAVINHTYFRDVDIVVPRSKVDQMYEAIVIIANKYNFDYTVFGHIGDGNFHVNIFQKKQQTIEEWESNIAIWVREIFLKALELGGTISGEHGVGKTNLPYIEEAIPTNQLKIMNDIKKLFDVNQIINQ